MFYVIHKSKVSAVHLKIDSAIVSK